MARRKQAFFECSKNSCNVNFVQAKVQALQNQSHDPRVKIKGTELDTVMNTRYLDVNIDSSLDWKEYTEAIFFKVSRTIGFLKHARNFLPQDTLKTLYTGIVEPHFRYCCPAWGCCGKTDLDQLQKMQKTEPQELWRTAVTMFHVRLCYTGLNAAKTMVFKSLNEFGPKYMHKIFTKNSHFTERNLRSTSTELRLPLRKSAVGQKNF